MKRIVTWVRAIFSRSQVPDVSQPGEPLSVEDLPMPDIYAVEHLDTVPVLKIIDLSSPDIDKATGFDPYDTAVFRKTKQ